MLTIICGEDNVASRNYFLELKEGFKKKDYHVVEVLPNKIEDIFNWMSQAVSLFEKNQVFFVENLYQKFLKKNREKKEKILDQLNNLAEKIYDWEDNISAYQLKAKNKKITVKEFKLPQSIFKLLETCYPGNLKEFFTLLHQLPKTIEEGMLLFMLARHIRNMILIKEENFAQNIAFWQLKKLKWQAQLWPKDKLIDFYDGLYRIEFLAKTSATPFNIKESLDILASFYL